MVRDMLAARLEAPSFMIAFIGLFVALRDEQIVALTSDALAARLEAPSFMMAQLNGSAAGQTVPHYHMHILPRHDGLELEFHARAPEDMAVLNETAEKIRTQI